MATKMRRFCCSQMNPHPRAAAGSCGPPERKQDDDADDNGEDGGARAGMGQNFEQHRQEVVTMAVMSHAAPGRYRAAQSRSPSPRCAPQYHASADCRGKPGGWKP
jgi:hypothetical protein